MRQTKSAWMMGLRSAASFWTLLTLSPARVNVLWMVAKDTERNQPSSSQWAYSSRNRVGLWCARLNRYWQSGCMSFWGRPQPITWALATLPVICFCLAAYLRVDSENWTIWSVYSSPYAQAFIRRAASLRLSLIHWLPIEYSWQARTKRDVVQWDSFIIYIFHRMSLFLKTAINVIAPARNKIQVPFKLWWKL